MKIYPRQDSEMTQEAAFATVRGQSTIACGSMLTKLLKGISLAEVGQVIQLYGAGRDTVS